MEKIQYLNEHSIVKFNKNHSFHSSIESSNLIAALTNFKVPRKYHFCSYIGNKYFFFLQKVHDYTRVSTRAGLAVRPTLDRSTNRFRKHFACFNRKHLIINVNIKINEHNMHQYSYRLTIIQL
jgi:hypothetical protein